MKRTFPVTPIFTIGTPSRPVTSDQLAAAAPPPVRREGPTTPIDIPITPPRTDRMSSYDRGKCVALELDENTVPAALLETRNINLSFLIGFFKHSECYLRKTSYENIIKEMKNLGCGEIFQIIRHYSLLSAQPSIHIKKSSPILKQNGLLRNSLKINTEYSMLRMNLRFQKLYATTAVVELGVLPKKRLQH